jgi:hypothetical protein
MRIHRYPIDCAMDGAIQISTRRWGYITIHWLRKKWVRDEYKGRRLRPGLCVSPNATPWGATLLIGKDFARYEKRLAKLRRVLWGHGYSTEEHDPQKADAYLASFAGDLPGEQSATWIFEVLRAINTLRNDEGASVTIFCDNPEAHHDYEQAAIEVCDEWTGWKAQRFTGKDWAVAVLNAAKARVSEARKAAFGGGK